MMSEDSRSMLESSDDATSRAPVALAAGPDLATTVAAAMTAVGALSCDACILDEVTVVAGAGHDRGRMRDVVAAVVARARQEIATVRTVYPPGGLGLLRAVRRPAAGAGWVSVDVSARTAHFTEVLIPRELAAIGAMIAVTSIAGERRARPPLAIGVWTAYAHPRHALGARLTGERYGLAAEIALAFAPRVYVIAGDLGARAVVVATQDPIAA
jgi:hypothetical protein